MFWVKRNAANLHECNGNIRKAMKEKEHSGFHLSGRRFSCGPNPDHIQKAGAHENRSHFWSPSFQGWALILHTLKTCFFSYLFCFIYEKNHIKNMSFSMFFYFLSLLKFILDKKKHQPCFFHDSPKRGPNIRDVQFGLAK